MLTVPFVTVTTNLTPSPVPQVFSTAVCCVGSKALPIVVPAKVAVQVLVAVAKITSAAMVASAGKGLPSRSASCTVTLHAVGFIKTQTPWFLSGSASLSSVTSLELAGTIRVRLVTGIGMF